MTGPIDWQWCHFRALSGAEVYAVLAQRQHVFTLEQQCLYNDIDGLDSDAHHLLGWRTVNGQPALSAYLRCLAPGVKFTEMSLGRVLTSVDARGMGLGRELVAQGILHAEQTWPGHAIRIAAQQHLARFYAGFGFEIIGAPYDEDGIMHVDMLRPLEQQGR
jgi:ElaA protein